MCVCVYTIFVSDADLLAISVPLHVPHSTPISIVYHLLIPNTLRTSEKVASPVNLC